MSETILIESIKTDRKLDDGEDVKDLANLIAGFGLKVPVLLDHNHILIDGLRRIEAMKVLGETTVPAIVAETYEEAISNLMQAHKGRSSVGPRRTWEITESIHELMQERMARIKREKMLGLPREERYKRPYPTRSRVLLSDALNDHNTAKYAQVFRTATSGDQHAREVCRALEIGELTVNQALHRLATRSKMIRGDVKLLSEQRNLLRGATRNLSGLVKGLKKLGAPILLPKAELDEIVKELKIHRADLVSMIRQIEKESHKK